MPAVPGENMVIGLLEKGEKEQATVKLEEMNKIGLVQYPRTLKEEKRNQE